MNSVLDKARGLIDRLDEGFPEAANSIRSAVADGQADQVILNSLRNALASWTPFLPPEMKPEVIELRTEVEAILESLE
jgi:hypothetical protein